MHVYNKQLRYLVYKNGIERDYRQHEGHSGTKPAYAKLNGSTQTRPSRVWVKVDLILGISDTMSF